MWSVDIDWLQHHEGRILPSKLFDVPLYVCSCKHVLTSNFSHQILTYLQALVMFPLPIITIKMMDVFKKLYVYPGKSAFVLLCFVYSCGQYEV